MNHQNYEYELINFWNNLFKYKFFVIIITLVTSLSIFFIGANKKPFYYSSVGIEIGQYILPDGSSQNIEDPRQLVQRFKAQFFHKNQNEDFLNFKITNLQDRLIRMEYSSGSEERNILLLDEMVTYILNEHALISGKRQHIYDLQTSNYLTSIETNKEFLKEQLKYYTELEATIDSINSLDNSALVYGKAYIDVKLPVVNRKFEILKELSDLRNPDEMLEEYIYTKNLAALDSNKLIKTSTYQNITTSTKKVNNLLTVTLGFIAGLVLSIFFILFYEFLKNITKINRLES